MTRARTTDPQTSHAAARHVESTGLAQRQRDVVLACVKRWPNRTTQELAANHRHGGGELTEHDFGRRISELEREGRVASPRVRECKVTGRQAREWMLSANRPVNEPITAYIAAGMPDGMYAVKLPRRSPGTPAGWTDESWARRLLVLADACRALRPDLAAGHEAEAERAAKA